MTRLDRPTKQRMLAMIVSLWAGGLAGIYVERALSHGWDAEIVFTTKLVVSVGVTMGMTAALFWLIGRLGKSR